MLPRPSLDDLRALRPDLAMALFAMDPGQGVTLEIYHEGQVYPFKGATVADAILAAFPPKADKPAAPRECDCTNPNHGGKLWLCNTDQCPKLKAAPTPPQPDSIFD